VLGDVLHSIISLKFFPIRGTPWSLCWPVKHTWPVVKDQEGARWVPGGPQPLSTAVELVQIIRIQIGIYKKNNYILFNDINMLQILSIPTNGSTTIKRLQTAAVTFLAWSSPEMVLR
jgi:hypothetical protein